MTNFFRKIPQSLVVLVLVLAVLIGHAFAVEGDTSASAPVDSAPVSVPDTFSDGVPADAGGSDLDDDGGGSYYPSYGGYDTFTVSGADVTVNVEKHDTLSVVSVPLDDLEDSDSLVSFQSDAETPTLTEIIRSLFGSYTPRAQTVTTYYDGQPISMDEQIVPGLAGLDYEWLVGVGMFALTIFCLFRLLGGVLKNG